MQSEASSGKIMWFQDVMIAYINLINTIIESDP